MELGLMERIERRRECQELENACEQKKEYKAKNESLSNQRRKNGPCRCGEQRSAL
jgi:hypothetical protein